MLVALGLILACLGIYAALKFSRTILAITQNNPSLITARDTLRINQDYDTLLDLNATLNQQIAEKLIGRAGQQKSRQQMLLHQTISAFILEMDSLQQFYLEPEVASKKLKNAVNRTNIECRASLFDIQEANHIKELETFLIADEKNLGNTIFECFSQKEIKPVCYDKIKHQAYLIETIILEKNFNQLKNE